MEMEPAQELEAMEKDLHIPMSILYMFIKKILNWQIDIYIING